MKRQSYIAAKELMDLFRVGIMAAEFRSVAERTPEKDWAKKLKIMATYCENIMNERLACIKDLEQVKSVKRRYAHTEMKFISTDDWRSNKDKYEKQDMLTVETEVLYDLLDLAMLTCYKCPQGKCVKDCHWRKHFHTLAVPPFRTEPAEGECEFRYDPVGDARNVSPQYRTVELLAEEQKRLQLRE